jgi:hypothetical protein
MIATCSYHFDAPACLNVFRVRLRIIDHCTSFIHQQQQTIFTQDVINATGCKALCPIFKRLINP